jgi:hypothetical protein
MLPAISGGLWRNSETLSRPTAKPRGADGGPKDLDRPLSAK